MLDPAPGYLDCPSCGTSVAPAALGRHRCDDRHRDDHEQRIAVESAASLDRDFGAYLATPEGRFAEFYAARQRRP